MAQLGLNFKLATEEPRSLIHTQESQLAATGEVPYSLRYYKSLAIVANRQPYQVIFEFELYRNVRGF